MRGKVTAGEAIAVAVHVVGTGEVAEGGDDTDRPQPVYSLSIYA